MVAEPTYEELSAYADGETTAAERRAIEAHLDECESCRRRLEALRQTVSAVRALPLERPAKRVSIPAQRDQHPGAWRTMRGWSGWAAAAALLVVGAFVLHQVQLGGSHGAAAGINQAKDRGASAFAPRVTTVPGSGALATDAALANSMTVTDPTDPGRRLVLSSNGTAYPRSSVILVRVLATDPGVVSGDVRLELVDSSGYGVELPASPLQQGQHVISWSAGYRLSDLKLPATASGQYFIEGTWSLPNSHGEVLVARLPVSIAGG